MLTGQRSKRYFPEGGEFIEGLRERLLFLRELLDEDGCIFVRLDYHFGHYIKVILDEIFDYNFENACNIMSRNILHNLFSSLLLSANYFITFFERCNFTFEYTL